MRGNLSRVLVLVLAAALLLSVPGVVGCGGAEVGGVQEIIIGVEADFTGPASLAVVDTIEGMQDYFRMVEEENLLPDAKVKFITYDERLDYARTVPGYIWLKGQGAVMMHIINAADRDILADRFEEDGIPVVGSQGKLDLLDNQWMFNLQPPIESQAESILTWIAEDYSGEGVPKVGHIGVNYQMTDSYQNGIEATLAANPGDFEWVGCEKSPVGTTAWAVEIGKFMDCDYTVVSLVGPMLASFVRESRDRGYEGAFVTGIEGFPGYMDLVRGTASPGDLYDCYYVSWWPWWGEDVPLIHDLEDYVPRYRPDDYASRMKGSSPVSGWGFGLFMFDAIKRAVESVGAENVDGTVMRDALAETNMNVEGVGNAWTFSETNNCLAWAQRAFQWNMAEEKFEAISDWMMPASAPVE